MGNWEVGECSKNKDDDKLNENGERPLKKARFVWQVKGKYHLKNNVSSKHSNKNSGEVMDDPVHQVEDRVSNNSLEIPNDESRNNNNNINSNGRCCLQALLAQSDVMMNIEDSSDEESPPNIDKSILDEIPVTLVKPNLKNEDYYLHRWQARQVAKGFLDNTINKILENWMVAPFDATDLIENCEDDGQIEDEGILMAIQSHGLQTGFGNAEEGSCGFGVENRRCRESSSSSSSSLLQTVEVPESTLDNFQNVHNELLKRTNLQSSDNSNCLYANSEIKDHLDFLNAAVSVAIQKKGLS